MVERFIGANIVLHEEQLESVNTISALKAVLKTYLFPIDINNFCRNIEQTLDPIKQMRWKYNGELIELNIKYEYSVFSHYEETQVFTEIY